MGSERWPMSTMGCLLGALVLGACEDLTFETGRTPTVDGAWEGPVGVDGRVQLLLVEVAPQDVRGQGHLSFADTSIAVDASGVHRFPSVSLTLSSDSLRLNFTGVRSEWTEPLRFGVDTVSMVGELNGSGYVREPVALVRQDHHGAPSG